jgi:hypothetical protein
VFVSSQVYNGALGGLSGADSICNTLAVNAGLGGVYKAWLADSVESPATRFAQSASPYRLVNGPIIAASWSDLTDGSLLASIHLDETGAPQTSEYRVWSGTAADGTAAGAHCMSWTRSSGPVSGSHGRSDETGPGWSQTGTVNCSGLLHLYCFEQ